MPTTTRAEHCARRLARQTRIAREQAEECARRSGIIPVLGRDLTDAELDGREPLDLPRWLESTRDDDMDDLWGEIGERFACDPADVIDQIAASVASGRHA